MSVFEMIFGNIGEDSDEDEEEKEEETQPAPKVFTCDLDQALRTERMDLMKHHQKHKAEELDTEKDIIYLILEGAQEKLRGCNTIAPVRAFLRERVKASAPFCYKPKDGLKARPLTAEQWKFVQQNGDNILRILHNTFNPYVFPANLMLEQYENIFAKLHTDVAMELRGEAIHTTWRRVHAQLGSDEQEVVRFVQQHPAAELNDARLRRRLEESLNSVGGDDLVREMVAAVPTGLMAYSVQNLAECLDDVRITGSRENSPEKESVQEENSNDQASVKPEEDDDEEGDMKIMEMFPPPPPSTFVARAPKPTCSILKTKTWYRSDGDEVRDFPLFGNVTYSDYAATKKKVTFVSSRPTECRIYYIDRPKHHRFLKKWHLQRTGHTWGFKTSYSKYLLAKRYPNMHRLAAMTSPSTMFKPSKHVRRKLANKWDMLFAQMNRQSFPMCFLRDGPLRDSRGTSEMAWEIPAHAGKREGDLGELVDPSSLLSEYYAKMMAFVDMGHRACSLDDKPRPIANNVYGILMLTDSILEDVNPVTLLNAALFAFPPPLEASDAVDILINCGEVTHGMRDVVLSWGFEQLIVERNAAEAFASLCMFAMQVKAVLKEKVKKIAAERVNWDEVKMPRMWLFTIPEAGYYDADLLRGYNELVRLFCQDEPEFKLIDWADAWSRSPAEFYSVEDPLKTERSLQLFFRMCRQEMDLLYRRPYEERLAERPSFGTLGDGPSMKDVYAIFKKEVDEQRHRRN